MKYDISNPVVFVRVSGSSMEPEFHDQDVLLIERNIPPAMIRRNAYGIFADDQNQWTFKRFNPQGQVILLEPLNSQFNTIAVFPEDLRIFGIAIGLFRPLSPP
jgi:SOS-response transcriptional repressor LexA